MTNNPFSELQKKLEESIKSFPYVYLFKFIVKADNKSIALVQVCLETTRKFSKNNLQKEII